MVNTTQTPTSPMNKRKLLPAKIIFILASLFTLSLSHAEDRPLWEFGLGVGALNLPDYRGSDESRTYVLPVPFFVYRGEHLKADRSGVRGLLYDSEQVELNISINGTIPVDSEKNVARRGMADLKPTIEVGPTATIHLWHAADKKMKLDFRTPLRTSITVENSPKNIGWVFTPALNLDIKEPAGMSGWNLGLVSALVINDRRYNNHFYSVSAADATPTRPVYSAKGGYSGAQLTAALSKRFARHWVGGFVRYDSLSGAVFRDSPLVKRENTVSAGLAISWVISQSGQLAKKDDE